MPVCLGSWGDLTGLHIVDRALIGPCRTGCVSCPPCDRSSLVARPNSSVCKSLDGTICRFGGGAPGGGGLCVSSFCVGQAGCMCKRPEGDSNAMPERLAQACISWSSSTRSRIDSPKMRLAATRACTQSRACCLPASMTYGGSGSHRFAFRPRLSACVRALGRILRSPTQLT